MWLCTYSTIICQTILDAQQVDMDPAKQQQVIHQILSTNHSNAEILLEQLGVAGLPSREQVHREIEAKLLLPRERLPDHWLPTYQMCEILPISPLLSAESLCTDIGSTNYLFLPY
jgi:hypothetical protein